MIPARSQGCLLYAATGIAPGELGSQGKALAKRPAALISTARVGAGAALAEEGTFGIIETD